MGKPKIIGYETDHARTWSTPSLPELTYESAGVSVSDNAIDNRGNYFEYRRYLTSCELDSMMLACGMKRVYEPRQFRAERKYGGYLITCRKCGCTSLTSGYLPQDYAAKIHRCYP